MPESAEVQHEAAQGRARASPDGVRTPRVAAVIVTWNRREMVASVLEAIAKQDVPLASLDVFVIDNASTDGTLEHLIERFAPEAVYDNPTERAEAPAFERRENPGKQARNSLGVRTLSVVRNTHNLGGCGGFNTGFNIVAHAVGEPGEAGAPDYVWLVDDDVDLEPDVCAQLVRVAESDRAIGLVGSRTVDIRDRETTIETTIYHHPTLGIMGDEPEAGDPRLEEHRRWAEAFGGAKYGHGYHGTRDVDVVSACSMLARWSDTEAVGLWDARYFIYCDDADWCLRFKRAGRRVVLNLDAVVFHTPWHHKLTPARIYYAERNLIWMNQKALDGRSLRCTVRARLRHLLRESLHAGLCRRGFHAEVYLRAARDAMRGRGGKLDMEPSPSEATSACLQRIGASGRTLVLVIPTPDSMAAADAFRAHVLKAIPETERPRLIDFVRNDVPGVHDRASDDRIVYAPHLRSRLFRQFGLLKHRPAGVVVFDHACDVPMVSGRWTLHVGSAGPDRITTEACGLFARLGIMARWLGTLGRGLVFGFAVRPHRSRTRYG
ncbi:MAG: glycosyltransferase family 2 protein [Phycisphaerales bacterium]|nr:MAG: glycosyltransferase family 2 protein [Phycisphaerales bacterium]